MAAHLKCLYKDEKKNEDNKKLPSVEEKKNCQKKKIMCAAKSCMNKLCVIFLFILGFIRKKNCKIFKPGACIDFCRTFAEPFFSVLVNVSFEDVI